MPTGYTAAIAEGITFEQYAMSCARAFGALVEMRDAPSDAPIPEEFKPSDYHLEALNKANTELKELFSLTPEAVRLKAKQAHEKSVAYHTAGRAKQEELKLKYEAMLAKAQAYIPPSPDHDGLKEFMVRQIEESIQFDCQSSYHADEWFQSERVRIKGAIKHHKKGYADDVARTKSRNEWIRKLRASTKDSPALQLLSVVWNDGMKDSWGRINHAMHSALELAIGSGVHFNLGDFAEISRRFDWGYWVNDNPEWIYTDAILNLNESAIAAWETYKGREAFRGNNVSTFGHRRSFLHVTSPSRKRERLGVGMYFEDAERNKWWVNGFDDKAGIIRVASYYSDSNKGGWQQGKPTKLKKLTHDDLREICPAPKKPKKKAANNE